MTGEGTFTEAFAMPVVARLLGCDWGRRVAVHGLAKERCLLLATDRFALCTNADGEVLVQVCPQHAKSLLRNSLPITHEPHIQNPEAAMSDDPESPAPSNPSVDNEPEATEAAVPVAEKPALPDPQQAAHNITVEQIAIALNRAKEPPLAGLGMRPRREIASTTLEVLRQIAPANAAAAIGLPKPPKVHDYSGLKPYTVPVAKATAIIVDLDGTVCLRDNRSPYDYSLVTTDLPNNAVLDIIDSLAVSGHKVIFLSGRPDGCRADTEAWIDRYYGRQYEALHMRATGDTRTDWIVKEELFTAHIRDQYKVAAVFDDRNQVVGMWRAIGLPVFQVAEGDF